MCGIAGIVNTGRSEPRINEKILKDMSDVIIHRGPDSEGQWMSPDKRCGLSFRRLSIIDLSSAGNQPMSTPDGRYTIVFNGEIYNHMEIREGLIKRGYKYRSATDTETILYGYAEYGPDIVNKMTGMWGFAIWDNEKKELFCSRDRIGIKPFYFTRQNGSFVFGSEIKSILQHPDVKAEFNEIELPNYLNFGMTSNRESLFAEIKKLPAAHFLLVKSDGTIDRIRYWSPFRENPEYTGLSSVEIQAEVIRIIREGIKDRMMSDVPFGAFLSGGIDSSLNVALMDELMGRPVDTFTVGFKELEKYNELEYARQVAKQWKTNHHEILIDHEDTFPILDDLVWHEDEPNADPVCIPLYFLSKLTRESGTIVIQVGEGSDEQFVGYPWMMREYNFFRTYWKIFTAMPGMIRKPVYGMAKLLLSPFNQYQMIEYFRRGAYGENLYWSGASIISPSYLKKMINREHHYLNSIPAQYAGEIHETALSFKKDADYLQRILFIELSQRLAELLLMRVDKIGMAHSIEARVPFLDHRLVEFTMSIPPFKKAPDNKETKYILKKAVGSILPENIIYRKKQGFWAPVNEWLRGQWYEYAKNEILNSGVMEYGILNAGFIKRMFQAHKSGRNNFGLQLFTLLMLSLWHKKFFGK